ncbi:MAG: hypothetical protein IT423_22295 [Pirellulaceae bacterium]|nr:hypothetical protein [Pirellulaceae bacterium]
MSIRDHSVVVAEYFDYEKADIGLRVLEMRGFGSDRVSVITQNDPKLVELEKARRAQTERPGVVESGAVGAALAAGAAAPLAVGTLLTPFFIIGPVVAAAAGAAVGTLSSADSHWDIDDDSTANDQQRVAEGSILVLVHATGDDLLEAYGGLKTTDTLSLKTF